MPMANAMTISAQADFHARVGSRLGIHEIADALGKFKVEFGEAALAVGREDDAHLRVADVNVRVMVVLLGEFRDAVHEINGPCEVVEFKRALDGIFFEIPFGEIFEGGFDLLGVEKIWHGGRNVVREIARRTGLATGFCAARRDWGLICRRTLLGIFTLSGPAISV